MKDFNEMEFDKWPQLVGGFILAFGEIELITFRLWRTYYPIADPPNNFKDRASKLLSKLKESGFENGPVIRLLIQALRLADKRNTIAHNPMMVQTYIHTKTGKLFEELAIMSETDDNYITDADLIALKTEVEEILAQLYIQIGYA